MIDKLLVLIRNNKRIMSIIKSIYDYLDIFLERSNACSGNSYIQ